MLDAEQPTQPPRVCGVLKGNICVVCIDAFRVARGLCNKCYGRAVKRVKAGTTTWTKLEEEGKCVAIRKRIPYHQRKT